MYASALSRPATLRVLQLLPAGVDVIGRLSAIEQPAAAFGSTTLVRAR
jgi:hypothetical protein